MMNGKLNILKLRSVVEKNILDNDRLQQKAEARKSSDSRLEIDNKLEKSKSSDTIDNIKHHNNEESRNDNYQLVDSESTARRKKKKKKKSERPDYVPSQKAVLSNSDCKSDEFDAKNANSKLDVRNRFSCDAGPRLPKR